MKILFDIGHPAHVHFFKNAIRMLKEQHHKVTVTSRHKEIATHLLDELKIEHTPLSKLKKGGLLSLGKELIQRNVALYKFVRRFQPDIMAAIGGVSIAHVGKITGIPSLVFYDTENAKLQNAITYPFAACVLVPNCYQAWTPKARTVRYPGYHELAYLHPNVFTADKQIAINNGLALTQDTFFLRLVSWQANHDIGETGWSSNLSEKLVSYLAKKGKVIISSECELPAGLKKYTYQGKLSAIHHLMAHCRIVIGESATMASEAAVLGVPALYIANTGRGYTDEQESKYHLVKNIKELNYDTIIEKISQVLTKSTEYYQLEAKKLINESIDVSHYIVDCLVNYPAVLNQYQTNQHKKIIN